MPDNQAHQIELAFSHAITPRAYSIDLTFAHAKPICAHAIGIGYIQSIRRRLMLAPSMVGAIGLHTGYIAGAMDGIVTANGVPCAREILLMEADDNTYTISHRVHSLPNGHYMIDNLDPNKRYVILARDYTRTQGFGGYQPACFDYIRPANDLSLAQIAGLWQSFTSNSASNVLSMDISRSNTDSIGNTDSLDNTGTHGG